MIVSRTCTEVAERDEDRHPQEERRSRPLEEFRDTPAYVLLGDPGAGKTTAFESECEGLGEQAHCPPITADEFLSYDVSTLPPEWREKTLFIDGLDEVRAGAQGASEFREIRKLLRALGKPRFRLSCREADWLGENDRNHLESVSPDSSVTVLRLDPLTDADIASILDNRLDIANAGEFIETARERGVEGLLENPQTLEMVADVVGGGGGWPESRMQTFEMACRQIVEEHHQGHRAAQASKGPPVPGQLLDAAGRLCAVQLISGVAGYSMHEREVPGYPAPERCANDCAEMPRAALHTKLFKGAASSNRRTPVHRHVAEFLGARHLAEIIQKGLPARRVISLMTGEDDTVVTEMRGLSAWLAAHSKEARTNLIERDPIGVGLYGDIGEFSLDEKRTLLGSLNREGIRLGSLWSSEAAFGALATPEIEPVLREILKDGDRSPDHQTFTDFVLRVLKGGAALPSLSGILLEIVRDDTRWPRVNTSALNAFIHNCPDSEDRTGELRGLLAEIQRGCPSDPDDELLGILLAKLYPRDLPPSEVWDFYGKGRPNFFGSYYYFWEIDLVENSSNEQVAELLDHLTKWLPDPVSSPEVLAVDLLARGLEAHGDQLDSARLYNWLDVGCRKKAIGGNATGAFAYPRRNAGIREIRSWLEKRPEIQKAVILEGVIRCPGEFNLAAFQHQHLHLSSLPPDFGLWCLKQAVSMADAKPLVAEHLLDMAFQAHRDHSGNAGLSLEVLQEQARKNVRIEKRLDQLLSPSPIDQEHLEYQEKWRKEGEKERQQWFDHVRSNKTELLENRAAPRLLYEMAELYFMGPEVIEERFRGDRGLIDAVLQGLRGVIDREDVPELEEILRLRKQNKIHLLGLPFLAGIELAEKASEASQWDENRFRRAIAFCFDSPLDSSKPQLYQFLHAERPEIVAQVLVQFALSGFRSGRDFIDKLSELAHDPEYAKVARHASMPLLRAFPTRCKATRIQGLKDLLWAALQYADRVSLQELIDAKLSRKSMNDAQRVYWLAAGVIVSPEMYEDPLRKFSEGREGRIRHLAAFFSSHGSVRSVADELESPALELVVRLVGSTVGPDEQWKQGYFTPAMEACRLVGELIQRLAASPAKESSDALVKLLDDPTLSQWHDVLSRARDEQRVIRRDATYRHHDIEQVCRTLNGGTPANAADLAALVMDLLQKLADQIRKSDADDWSKYWNVDSHGRPVDPRHESTCRNTLLSDLRKLLPEGVSAGREGQHRNDKRDDIWVSRHAFRVPLEVKKNKNRRLWSALRNQLIAQYTSTPGSDGHGIYLVFWFGKKGTPPPPTGAPPTTAKDLEERLQATLSPVEARKISVCVVDVSRPDG